MNQFQDNLFGTFKQDNSTNWYEGYFLFNNNKISVYSLIPNNLQTLHVLYPKLDRLVKEAQLYASERLINLVKSELKKTVEKHELSNKMILHSIILPIDTNYRLYFTIDQILPEIPITVSGDANKGFLSTALEYIGEIIEEYPLDF
jgi:hypothetical protein